MLRFLLKKDADVLKKEYRLRFLTVASFILSLVLFMQIISLLPSYINLNSEEKFVTEEINSRENVSNREDPEGISDKFDLVRQVTGILKEDSKHATEYIKIIVNVQKPDISINTITFSKESNTIVVSGLASSREALKTFGDSLKDDAFEKADVPFSNFADSTNIPYTITITLRT